MDVKAEGEEMIKSCWFRLFSCNWSHIVQQQKPTEASRSYLEVAGFAEGDLLSLALVTGCVWGLSCSVSGVHPSCPWRCPCMSHAPAGLQWQTLGSSLCFYSYRTGTQNMPKIPHAKWKKRSLEYLVIDFAIRNLLVVILPWDRFQSSDWSQNRRDAVF